MDNATTSLTAWAQRVLHGQTMADKLWSPPQWSDDGRGTPVTIPRTPGRPPGLGLGPTEPLSLPSVEALAEPRARGLLLHRFANHELLALELMALALLRFPEAPAAFRRGLATTLAEEQRHLRAYTGRMRQLGVELGELPLGGFFWRVMAPMPSPLDFMAHMALTFEQANLDFALHHAACMRAAGDEPTARILDTVREDEIGHVKLGVVWIERWRERGPSLFEAHREALRPPITPRRARGLGFDREGRQRAGLPDDYIERIAQVQGSRGRPPVVHAFDPTAELSLGTRGAFTPSAATRAMTADMELLPAFAAHRDDVVLLSRAPRPSHLRTLSEAGLTVPEWIVAPEGPVPADAIPHPQLAGLHPWGWGPRARARLGALVDRTQPPPPAASTDAVLHAKTTWVGLDAELTNEDDTSWLAGPEHGPRVAHALPEAIEILGRMHARGYVRVVIKAPFGTSGRNAQRIDASGLTVPQRGWLARTLSVQGAVVIEPWLDRVCDVSLRITVRPDGSGRIDDVGRFIADARGQYLGAVLGPLARAVPPAVARLLNGEGRDPDRHARICQALATKVAAQVHAHGYTGPVGIDGLVFVDREGRLRLRPLVEVNVRPNLGHVVHGLQRQLAQGRAGLWVVFRLADRPPGQRTAEAIARARDVLPTMLDGSGRLRQGAIPTTDPECAQAVGTLLLVAGRRADALVALEAAVPTVATRLRAALQVEARGSTTPQNPRVPC